VIQCGLEQRLREKETKNSSRIVMESGGIPSLVWFCDLGIGFGEITVW